MLSSEETEQSAAATQPDNIHENLGESHISHPLAVHFESILSQLRAL